MEARRCAGKVALVTGASGGIGGSIARTLSAEGAAVALHYNRNAAPAEALAADITAAGGQAMCVGGDTTDAAQCAAIVQDVAARFGFIDILVNNAGALQNLPFGSVTKESFDSQFHVNTLSVVLMMQAAIPHFPERGGAVINLSTNIAASPLPGTTIYAAAKAAINAITAGFAKELGARGITVNAVAPGATDTAMLAWLEDEVRQGIAQATPLGRIGQPEDVAGVVAFFASDAARFVTGRSLIIDGGLV
jgi:3-oxoacyl-[acyl-carrier protein] reductase